MADSPGDLGDLVQRGYRFALSLTHDATGAEDLVQDAWFSVLKAGGPWTRKYIFATIRNRFIDLYRREQRAATEPLRDDPCEPLHGKAGLWDDDEILFAANGTLDSALGRLRPEERAVLYLASVEEYTAGEIAKLLDWPRGTVLSMMYRARQKLRRSLSPESESMT